MLTLFNTLARKKEPLKPLHDHEVGLYTCGPTVYNYAHIGNLRTYVFEDILKRTLVANGYRVKHVMNITDVGHLTSDADTGEDKMEKGARREHKTVWEIAEHYTNAFKENLKDLNILAPDIWARATDHIPEQIKLIKRLEEKGYAYRTSDGMYFDTAKFKHYGQLSGQKLSELQEGARVEKNPEKHNPTDFALWKFSPKGQKRQMEWPSPWGTGFPGWHIECSAMSMKYLGETLDIHCGAIDHIPTHHTNEIAQSEAATGKRFVNCWIHGEFLVLGKNEKMAKSAENFITLQTLKDKGYHPLAFRFLTLNTHYRKQLSFSWTALEAAQNALDNLYVLAANLGEPKIGCAEFEQQFQDTINDDLNMPQALAIVWNLLKSNNPDSAKKASLLKFDKVLGLNLIDTRYSLVSTLNSDYVFTTTTLLPESKDLIQERENARSKKDWKRSDEIRKKLESQGTKVSDKN